MATRENTGWLSRSRVVESSGINIFGLHGSGHAAATRRGSGEMFTEQPPRRYSTRRPWGGWIERSRLCRLDHHGLHGQRKCEGSRYNLRRANGSAALRDQVIAEVTHHGGFV